MQRPQRPTADPPEHSLLLTSNIVKNFTKISTWLLVAAGAALGKVQLFAILRGIRSNRKIAGTWIVGEVKHSIDFMWLVSGRTFDHSTISAFRRDHQQQVQKMYRDMVRLE